MVFHVTKWGYNVFVSGIEFTIFNIILKLDTMKLFKTISRKRIFFPCSMKSRAFFPKRSFIVSFCLTFSLFTGLLYTSFPTEIRAGRKSVRN